MNIILRSVALALFCLVFSLAVLAPDLVLAQADEIQQGVDSAAGGSGGNPETTLNNTIANVVEILSIVVGIMAVIMIVFAGYRYITSGGDTSKVASAKSTLIYAIIGLVIVALAQIIVKFVINTT